MSQRRQQSQATRVTPAQTICQFPARIAEHRIQLRKLAWFENHPIRNVRNNCLFGLPQFQKFALGEHLLDDKIQQVLVVGWMPATDIRPVIAAT